MKAFVKKRLSKVLENKFLNVWLWTGFASLFLGAFLIVTSELHEGANGSAELIISLDRSVSAFFNTIRTPKLNDIAIDLTALGSATVVTVFVFFVSIILILKERFQAVVHLILAAIGSAIVTSILKSHFERPRPSPLVHLVTVEGYSYPSGHSLASAAVYFTFGVLLCETFRTWASRIFVIGLTFLVILAVALSRVYLGVHYFSDVIAGGFVGVAWASLLSGFLEFRRTK